MTELSIDGGGQNGLLSSVRLVKDIVHDKMIALEEVCWKIIDTPQYQRLRKIHQNGPCMLVFPNATHTRFEHSIGTAYLAERLARKLQKHQPYLGITKEDILCVKIAGLCHDLGHGPFSHLYDGAFIPAARPGCPWKHEEASVQMLDHLLESNSIDLAPYGLEERDLLFIKEMILGQGLGHRGEFLGRPLSEGKEFLYDIINNSWSGLDVDKMDYLLRDQLMVGINTNSDYSILLKQARVAGERKEGARGRLHICFPDKLVGNVVSLFNARYTMHHRAYTHKSAKAAEQMIVDALLAADEHVRFKGCDGTRLKISEAHLDMVAYTRLNDSVLDLIESSELKEVERAQQILERIHKRELYKCVGRTCLGDFALHTCKKLAPSPCAICTGRLDGNGQPILKSPDELAKGIIAHSSEGLKVDNVIVDVLKLHHGKQSKNPVEQVRFFSKNSTFGDGCFKLTEAQYKGVCPSSWMETSIRLFVRQRDHSFTSRRGKRPEEERDRKAAHAVNAEPEKERARRHHQRHSQPKGKP